MVYSKCHMLIPFEKNIIHNQEFGGLSPPPMPLGNFAYIWSRYDRHFVGINMTYCVALKGESLPCYSNKAESVSLRKCPHDHWLTDKAYLSCITMTDISRSFIHKMAAKINWHRYGTKWRHRHPVLTINYNIALSALILLAGRQEEQTTCKNWAMRCWCGYLSAARCRSLAYGPADATASKKPHRLLPHLNPDWFYLSGTILPRLSWKRGR